MSSEELSSIVEMSSLTNKIDRFLLEDIVEHGVTIRWISPQNLLTHNRLDVAIKINYLESGSLANGYSFALYLDHIRILTLGSFSEPGNPIKTSSDDYVNGFKAIFDSLTRTSFDASKSLVPISINGSLLNGSHRVASCFVTGSMVKAAILANRPFSYDYRFFIERGMSLQNVEYAVGKFVEYACNVYVALIWPSAASSSIELEQHFSRVVYEKSVSVTFKGFHRLVSQVYSGEPWVGSVGNDFKGAAAKAEACYKTGSPLRVVVFQSDSIDSVRAIKERIRSECSIGKSSIHITDNREESVQLCHLLLNSNSLRFLEYGDPFAYPNIIDRINDLKLRISHASGSLVSLVIDGGTVLSMYGLRSSRDLDVISVEEMSLYLDDVDSHDSQLHFHGVDKVELVSNPQYYFYFYGMKFVTLEQVRRMKVSRNEDKDILDVMLIDSLGSNYKRYSWRRFLQHILPTLRFRFFVFEGRLAKILRGSRYYYRVRDIYRSFRNDER